MRSILFCVGLWACGSTSVETPTAVETPTTQASDSKQTAHFGETFSLTETLPASTLLADPAAQLGKTIRIEGRVADVCQKAGCWMVIAHEDKLMRVTMKNHAFSVAKDGVGAWAIIEGNVVEKANDPEEAAHYASESSKPELAPEHGMGERKFELVASGVEFRPS